MDDLLPLETLRNVKDLTLMLCHIRFEDELRWPDSWDQLTSITRLKLHCFKEDIDNRLCTYVLLPFRIRSLTDVEFPADFDLFVSSGEEYLVFLIGCLPVLSRLHIILRGLVRDESGSSQKNSQSIIEEGIERLKVICTAVQLRTPGSHSTFVFVNYDQKVESASAAEHLQVLVTLQ